MNLSRTILALSLALVGSQAAAADPYFRFPAVRGDTVVFTAEGGIDLQTPNGKIPVEVARRAKLLGLPVFALAGAVGDPARIVYEHGVDAFFSTAMRPCPMEMAMAEAETQLALGAENVMRTVLAGRAMPRG